MSGTEEYADVRQALRKAMPDDLPAAVEQRMEQRIMIFREQFDAPPPILRYRTSRWIGGFTMKRWITALGSVGIAASLGFLLLWGGMHSKPVSAMERMAAKIREAKSYKTTATMTMHLPYSLEPGKTTTTTEQTDTYYWLAPRSTRVESRSRIKGQKSLKHPEEEFMGIYPADKPSIRINHRTKTFLRFPPQVHQDIDSSVMARPENWGNLSGEADHDLGNKEINGKKAYGFEIDVKKMYPDFPAIGRMEIWIDSESDLPVLACLKIKFQGISGTVRATDFQWNIDLNPTLFDTTPPKGYKDITPEPPSLEQQFSQITQALDIYAKESAGNYPREKKIYSIISFAFGQKLGINMLKQPTTEEEVEKMRKYAKVSEGFLRISELHDYNPDAAYYGKTVGPNDKDKVLLRWKLDDGRYAVIFGDLHTETVTAEKLRALEGK